MDSTTAIAGRAGGRRLCIHSAGHVNVTAPKFVACSQNSYKDVWGRGYLTIYANVA